MLHCCRSEFANLFHTMTDMLNVFQSLHVSGIVNMSHASNMSLWRSSVAHVSLLFLDEHPEVRLPRYLELTRYSPALSLQLNGRCPQGLCVWCGVVWCGVVPCQGPFDSLWKKLFSPALPMQRVSSLQAAGVTRLRFPVALFAHPGYTNLLLSSLKSDGGVLCPSHCYGVYWFVGIICCVLALSRVCLFCNPAPCTAPLQMLEAFKEVVLHIVGVVPKASSTLRVTFVSRKPYSRFIEHSFLARQVKHD